MRTIIVPVEVQVPDGATHYSGDLTEGPVFFKMTMMLSEHWWRYDRTLNQWVLQSHFKPHWIKELPA